MTDFNKDEFVQKEMSNIQKHIQYWIDYRGTGDEYRKKHDLDCILTGGNLYADTLISLWLPLRYVLCKENTEKWKSYLEYEKNVLWPKKSNLKKDDVFMKDLKDNISDFIPNEELRGKAEKLFELGRTRANVIILPYRKWNTMRGQAPYWDYMPHFLYDLLNTEDERFLNMIQYWIEDQQLTMLFSDEEKLVKDNLKDLAGTGNVCKHNIISVDVDILLDSYIDILSKRKKAIEQGA